MLHFVLEPINKGRKEGHQQPGTEIRKRSFWKLFGGLKTRHQEPSTQPALDGAVPTEFVAHEESHRVIQNLRAASKILRERSGALPFSDPQIREASKTGREAIATAASKMSNHLEAQLSESTQGGDSSQAYTLKRVIVSEMIGSSPQVQYFLQPPREIRDATGIEMVVVTNSESSYSRGVSFIDAGKGNPYETYSNRAFHLVNDQTEKARLLDDVARVYEDVERNGVRRDEQDFTFVVKTDKGQPSQELENLRASLPFTSTLTPSSKLEVTAQNERATEEAEAKRIALAEAEEKKRQLLREQREQEARERKQAALDATMGIITGTHPEAAERIAPFTGEAVAYRPTISIERGTVSVEIMRFTDGTEASPVPVVITFPLGAAEFTPENVLIRRVGLGERGQEAQSISRMYSEYNTYSQLPDIIEIFGSLFNAGKGISMGTGPFAELRVAVEGRVVEFAQASPDDQQRILAALRETAQNMSDRYASSPLTAVLSELALHPQRAVEAGPEALGLRTSIVHLLTGERTPAVREGKGEKPAIQRASVSLNFDEINLLFDAPRDSQAKPGDSRKLQITMPLGGRDFRAEDILISIDGYRQQTPLSEITDAALLRQVSGYLEVALQGGITLPTVDVLAERMEIVAGQGRDKREYRVASSYGESASTEMVGKVINLLEQQRPHYPNSPLNAALEVALEAAHQPDPNYGPFSFMKPNVEQLAGYVNEKGELVPGTMLTSTDPELLATMGFWGEDVQEYAEVIHNGQQPSEDQTVRAIEAVEQFLRSKVLDLDKSRDEDNEFDASVLWLPNPDGFALQRGKKPIGRTFYEDFGTRSARGGTLTVGEANEEGDVPLRVDGEFTGISIEPTSSDERVDDVYEFVMENGKPTMGTDGQPIKQKVTGKGFRPAFKLTITEKTPTGESETYTLYRAELGTAVDSEQAILIQCSTADAPTMYTSNMITQYHVNVTRKPVIYLYPRKKINVTVRLDYKGQLTNTYPQIAGDTWKVTATPDGTLAVNGKKYKYLFWDGINGEVDWDWSEGFSVHRDDVDAFLEQKMETLGLNFAEAQDFITYWAPMMKQNEWTLVSFQTKRYEELAKLMIDPQPDTLLRVFMVFKKIDGKIDIPEQKLTKMKRKGFTVVEWGGSNVDELQIVQEDRVGKHSFMPTSHTVN